MLERKAYRSFRRQVSKILDDCKLSKADTISRPLSSYYDGTGFWEETKHIHYFFDVDKIQSHKNEVLALYSELPKLTSEIPGFAASIAPVSLLCNPSTRSLFLEQAMEIDEFSHLIQKLGLGLIIPIEVEGNKTFLISVFEEYRDQIQSRTC